MFIISFNAWSTKEIESYNNCTFTLTQKNEKGRKSTH